MTVTKQNLQFVYDPNLAKYLIKEHNIQFLVNGKHVKTDRQFWVFNRTDELTKLYTDWVKRKHINN